MSALYYYGDTSQAQEQELFELLQNLNVLSKEQLTTFTQLNAMQQMRAELGIKRNTTKPITKTLNRNRLWMKAACVAILVVALGTIAWISQPQKTEATITCYIDGEKIDDMQVMLEQLSFIEPIEDLETSLNEIENIIK